jgi:hypothetical protein
VPLVYNWRYFSASANPSKIIMHTNNHAVDFFPVFGTARLRDKQFPRISEIIKQNQSRSRNWESDEMGESYLNHYYWLP